MGSSVIFLKHQEKKLYYSLAAALGVVSFLLLRIPLFNYLGYEFSVAIALVMPCISGVLTIRVIRRRISSSDNLNAFRSDVRDAMLQCVTLLIIPLLLSVLNGVLVRNCAMDEGLLLFLLIPIVTTLWSVALAALCAKLVTRPLALFTSMMAAALAYPLYIGYTLPQIYSFNFIYGFFQGFSYDEVLLVTPAVWLSRFLTLLLAFFFYLFGEGLTRGGGIRWQMLVMMFSRFGWRSFVLPATAITLIASWTFRTELGFETSAYSIRKYLGSEYRTSHFRIYYSDRTLTADEVRRVAEMHEFRFSQVEKALSVEFRDTIDSYIYPDADAKRRLIGTGNTNIAKPWRREIHLNLDSWEATLKHELVHVMAGTFGMAVIGAHYNIGLVEGLATAIDGSYGHRTLREYAASLKVFGLVADPTRYIHPIGFATQASAISYLEMGAFCQYLIGRYGMEQFKRIYGPPVWSAMREVVGGKSVAEEVYGATFGELINQWQATLDSVDVSPSWKRHVSFYFNRQSIFARECARAVASRNENGFRFLEQKNPVAAMGVFQQALETSWNTDSYAGLIRSAFRAEQYDTVVAMMRSQMRDSAGNPAFANLLLLFGDALWYRGDTANASIAYEEVLALDLTPRYNEACAVRLLALSDSILCDSMAQYFVGSMVDSSAVRFLRRMALRSPIPVIPLLQARLHFRLKQYQQTLLALERATGSSGSAIIDAAREQLLAETYDLMGDAVRARGHFERSRVFITGRAALDAVEDDIERCRWYEQRHRINSVK